MKILEDNIVQYKLLKTMVTFMKIKYYQLVKAYLQIGNKKDFIHLMISNLMGPFQFFGEIIYYLKGLINNLVSNNNEKYYFNYSKNMPVYQQIDDTSYSHLKDNYKNKKKQKDK